MTLLSSCSETKPDTKQSYEDSKLRDDVIQDNHPAFPPNGFSVGKSRLDSYKYRNKSACSEDLSDIGEH